MLSGLNALSTALFLCALGQWSTYGNAGGADCAGWQVCSMAGVLRWTPFITAVYPWDFTWCVGLLRYWAVARLAHAMFVAQVPRHHADDGDEAFPHSLIQFLNPRAHSPGQAIHLG